MLRSRQDANPVFLQKIRQATDLQYWQSFVAEFFTDDGVYRTHLWELSDNRASPSHAHEIMMPVLARYFWMQFNSGVERMQICINDAKPKELPNGGYHVESERSTFTYWYESGSQVSTSTTCN